MGGLSASKGNGGAARGGRAVPHRGTRRRRARWVGPVVVLLGALIVRLVYVVETSDVPFARHLIGDAAAYYGWGMGIAGGEWLSEEAFYQAPLYPYVLGACFRVFGGAVWVVRVVQAVWGTLAVWCLWCGTSRLFGRETGLVAGIMLAVYGPALFFDGILQKASLGGVLVCALLAAMAWAGSERQVYRAAAVGLLAGLVVLTRENAMVWLPIVGLWTWVSWKATGWRRRFLSIAGYACGSACVLVPVGVCNKVVGGEWSVSTFQAGPNFYIGNHRGADGRYRPLVRGHETPAFEQRDARALAERDVGRKLSAREVSRYWMSRAISDIRADPVWWVGLMARKMMMVWNRYEVSDAESQYVYEDYSVTLRLLCPVWHFGVLCPLAAVGVVSTWGERRRLWVYYALVVSMAVAVAFFYVMARYRFPLVPVLIPFAAAGCVDVRRQVRSRKLRRLLWQAVVALIVAVAVNWPVHDEERLNAMARMNVGVALAEEGDLAGATRYFRMTVEGHPESVEANNNLAQALALQGDYVGAIAHYQAALASEPTLIGVEYNLAVALEQVGRPAEALSHYERAVELDPSDVEARKAISRLRERR